MIIALVLSFVISTTAGALLLRLVWPHSAAACPWPLNVALGSGIGAGISAVLLFIWMLGFGPTRFFPLAETGLVALMAVGYWRSRDAIRPQSSPAPRDSRLLLLLVPIFLVTLAAAAWAFLSNLRQHPHGEWDAWMNWNLRARMFFRGGAEWQAAFSASIPWSHPDYPVLLPSLVTRTWLYAGSETLLGAPLVAATFTFGTVALLSAALATLRSPSQGLLGGLVLLSTPFYIVHGTSLYADVPLSFFFLATIVFLALDGRFGSSTSRFAMLAGMAAGLAMWTKNEGTLFTLAVGAALLLAGATGGWAVSARQLRAFGTGLVPMLLLVAGFKLGLAPPNDLLSTLGVERTLDRLSTADRYYTVLREYRNHIASFGSNRLGSAVLVLAVYVVGFGVSRPEVTRRSVKAGAIALVLLLAGHFMVFVSMAHELSRLLASSLDRLLLQLWPSALFLFFMAVRAPEEVGIAPRIMRQPG